MGESVGCAVAADLLKPGSDGVVTSVMTRDAATWMHNYYDRQRVAL